MDELKALQAENDYDELMKKVQDVDIDGVFHGYNSRVLVSSFMLYKFRDAYNINDELFRLSKLIADAMVDLNFTILSQYYKDYCVEFLKWRELDIDQMRNDIRQQVEACRNTVTPPMDIADDTWNECMENSIELMNRSEKQLEKLSKTPPKI